MIFILLNYANSQIQRSVLKRISVEELTTEWKDSTIRTNTRLNSVTFIQTRSLNVNTVTIVRLPIQLKISKWDWSIMFFLRIRILIFIYSTSKLNGVLSIMTIIKLNVFMRITSKIIEENLICSDMILNFVKIGKVELSLLVMKKAVKDYKLANSVMVGKNNNSIPLFTKLNLVKNKNVSKDLNVHFSIIKRTRGPLKWSKMRILISYLYVKKETSNVLNNQTWWNYIMRIT